MRRSHVRDFPEVSWEEIAARVHGTAERWPNFRHIADIVDSIRTCGGTSHLAAITAMHDLLVTTTPVGSGRVEVIAVRSPSSLVAVGTGHVLIEHLDAAGQVGDRISRPVEEGVALFWRFAIEKFGVAPVR